MESNQWEKQQSKVSKDNRKGQKILFLDSKCLSAIFLAFIQCFLPKKGEIKICQKQQFYYKWTGFPSCPMSPDFTAKCHMPVHSKRSGNKEKSLFFYRKFLLTFKWHILNVEINNPHKAGRIHSCKTSNPPEWVNIQQNPCSKLNDL